MRMRICLTSRSLFKIFAGEEPGHRLYAEFLRSWSRCRAHAQYSTRGNEEIYFHVGKSATLWGRLGGLRTLSQSR